MYGYYNVQSHYSLKKGAAFLGVGTESIISVKTDDGGRMIPEELEKQIKASIAEVRWRAVEILGLFKIIGQLMLMTTNSLPVSDVFFI